MLDLYYQLTGSMGNSILLLSFMFSFLLFPIQKRCKLFEEKICAKINLVNAELEKIKGKYKGESLFIETEKIYNKYNYHPAKSMAVGAGFLVMLPILISAIFLMSGNPILEGKSFLFIDDLSSPDKVLGPINILPFLMSIVTLIDAKIRYNNDKSAQIRFFIIAIVLLILVYNMPAGLVLYWTGSNIFSLFSNSIRR